MVPPGDRMAAFVQYNHLANRRSEAPHSRHQPAVVAAPVRTQQKLGEPMQRAEKIYTLCKCDEINIFHNIA